MNRNAIFELLNSSPYPWVRYNTARHLLHLPESDPRVEKAYRDTVRHPLVKSEIATCRAWPDPPLKSHKAAGHPIHHLRVLADLGLSIETPGVRSIVKKITGKQGNDGALQSMVILPGMWGGSNTPDWLWMYCDAPILLHACLALGVAVSNPVMKSAIDHLRKLHRDKGYICASSLQKLRGPGRKDDPCPYATLLTLRVFSLLEPEYDMPLCREGTEVLLSHWENRKHYKLRMFGIGTEFMKVKYPFVFYDILHVVDVLSHFPWVWQDKRFSELICAIDIKRNVDGFFIPESVWMAFKGFDFAQKKEPSHTLTYLVERILERGKAYGVKR